MHPLLSARRSLARALSLVLLLMLSVAVVGCGAEKEPTADPADGGPAYDGSVSCPPGELLLDGGGCQPAGLPPDMPCPTGEVPLEGGGCDPAGLPSGMACPPGETPLEGGGCQAAGVPKEGCGKGFAPDGQGGCDPILPASPCPHGKMAALGETECCEVAPCDPGDYGSIPVDMTTTQFVNGAFTGPVSNGTIAKPWKHIQEGIDHAANGAIVAVAAGSYPEDIRIQSKPVKLWGRCPALVEVVGTGNQATVLAVLTSTASNTEVHTLAITAAKPSEGIVTSGATGVLIDRVWIHDTGDWGIDIYDNLGASSLTLSGSLVEAATREGVNVDGADATIETTTVRGTQPGSGGNFGRGFNIHNHGVRRSKVTLRSSVVEQNHEIGVYIGGSDVSLEATAVRNTQPMANGESGRGIEIEYNPDGHQRPKVTLRSSVVEQNHEVGVGVLGADATLERMTVRGTLDRAGHNNGEGIGLQKLPGTQERANVTLRASLVAHNHASGVYVDESDATIEGTILRENQPNSDGTGGEGIAIFGGLTAHDRAKVTIRTSILEQNQDFGVYAIGSDATIESTIVRATQPRSDGQHGLGISVQEEAVTHERGMLVVRDSLLEQNYNVGVAISGSDATIETTVVRGDGTLARGIQVADNFDTHNRSSVALRGARIEHSYDVGVLISGSDATIESTTVRDTWPDSDGTHGDGILIDDSVMAGRSTVTLRASLVEDNHDVGVFVVGSDATIESTTVRNTAPDSSLAHGYGIEIADSANTQERARLTLRSSLVEQNGAAGVIVGNSDATLEAILVRENQADSSGHAGDGIVALSHEAPSTVTIRSSRVQANARAGIASFSAAVILTSSAVQCNTFDLDGEEELPGQRFTFEGSRGNLCGCKDNLTPSCQVLSSNLSPPPPSDPIDPSQ